MRTLLLMPGKSLVTTLCDETGSQPHKKGSRDIRITTFCPPCTLKMSFRHWQGGRFLIPTNLPTISFSNIYSLTSSGAITRLDNWEICAHRRHAGKDQIGFFHGIGNTDGSNVCLGANATPFDHLGIFSLYVNAPFTDTDAELIEDWVQYLKSYQPEEKKNSVSEPSPVSPEIDWIPRGPIPYDTLIRGHVDALASVSSSHASKKEMSIPLIPCSKHGMNSYVSILDNTIVKIKEKAK